MTKLSPEMLHQFANQTFTNRQLRDVVPFYIKLVHVAAVAQRLRNTRKPIVSENNTEFSNIFVAIFYMIDSWVDCKGHQLDRLKWGPVSQNINSVFKFPTIETDILLSPRSWFVSIGDRSLLVAGSCVRNDLPETVCVAPRYHLINNCLKLLWFRCYHLINNWLKLLCFRRYYSGELLFLSFTGDLALG